MSNEGCDAAFPANLGARHLASAARHTIDGFKACFKSEVAFRQEVFVGVLNLIAVALLPMHAAARFCMVALWFLLVCVELLNSARVLRELGCILDCAHSFLVRLNGRTNEESI